MIAYLLTFAYAAPVENYKLFGANPTAPSDFAAIICNVVKLSLDFIPFLVVLAVGEFIMGLIRYVGHGDNEEKRTEGRKMMIYGIVGFFFMVSIWGVLGIFTKSFGLEAVIPQFNGKSFATVCS
jgi:hypothetical protein